MNKERDISIDYVKAIGIIIVVIGHYPVNFFNIVAPYYYHMPLFFFIGGVLSNTSKSIASMFKKSIKEYYLFILVVFVITAFVANIVNSVTGVQYNSLFADGFLELIKQTFEKNFHNNSLFTVAWFLLAYSVVAMAGVKILKIIELFSAHKTILCAVSVITCGLAGMRLLPSLYTETNSFYYNTLAQIFTGMAFYIIGYMAKYSKLEFKNTYCAMACFLFIYMAGTAMNVEPMVMAWSKYPTGMVSQFAVALCGIYIVFYIGNIMNLLEENKAMSMIGRSSKYVMAFHLSSFFVVDQSLYHLGLFSYLDSHGINKAPILFTINVVFSIFISVMIKKLVANVMAAIRHK